jgi:hypothetical protein
MTNGVSKNNQSNARTRLVSVGFTNEQAEVLTDVIWNYGQKGAGSESPASTMYLEHVAGRAVRALVLWQVCLAAVIVLAIKFVH